MPIGALMTASTLVLSASPPATSAVQQGAPSGGTSLNEAPVAGEVAATATVSDTEHSRQTRKATVVLTRKLTPKVKASARATSRAWRSAQATSTVKVTRYAPSYPQALAEAKAVAEQAAHDRAAKAARARAGKLALTRAKAVAKARARRKANLAVRKRFGDVVLRDAASLRGRPYRYGAAGPNAFDCSGFVKYVMKEVGVRLPRTADAMASTARHVAKSRIQRGDLVFFTGGGSVYHVAVYAGNGKIWHSPRSGESVQKVEIWTSSYQVGRVPV
jgi:cell wall-associated NlpC family hydrolase